jgi:2-polyprenyl-6-methoxyphenol hydroxylase-like FAD-dependent oxidoreductase
LFDVVVVGARCAGAALALLLARSGLRVALVDRATFPSDKLSTHFLWQRGSARLRNWAVLDRLHASGCDPIRELAVDFDGVTLAGRGPAVDEMADTYCIRRTILDRALIDVAITSGTELVDGCNVEQLEWSDGRVIGVVARRRDGTAVRLRGHLVVGADGLHSAVARLVSAGTYAYQSALTCVYYAYWSGIVPRAAAFYIRPNRLILVWPTNDDLTCISVVWPYGDFRTVRQDIEAHFLESLGLVPHLRERVLAGRRETRFMGTADLPNQYRVSHGPGWALIGDAGHHKDPSTGMGMADAFVSAELLADALSSTTLEARMCDAAVAAYARQRDVATANSLRLTLSTARLSPVSDELLAFYSAAAAQPALTSRILGVLGGSIPIEQVFSRDSIRAALSRTPT